MALSLLDHFNNCLWGFLKTVAVENGHLDKTPAEDDLAGPVPAPAPGIDAELLAHARSARQSFLRNFPDEGSPSSDAIKHTLDQKYKKLVQLDKYFKIERELYMGTSGATGEQRVEAMVLRALPDGPSEDLAATSAKVKALVKSPIVAWCGLGVQNRVGLCSDNLKRMVDGVPPKRDIAKKRV